MKQRPFEAAGETFGWDPKVKQWSRWTPETNWEPVAEDDVPAEFLKAAKDSQEDDDDEGAA